MRAPIRRREAERGEGSWGNLVMLILTALAAVAVFSAGPVFMKNFEFEDKIRDISRSFPPGEKGNESAREALAAAIEELNLGEYVSLDDCSVTNLGAIGGTRTVECTYTREYKLLPGMTRKYTFTPSATSPTF